MRKAKIAAMIFGGVSTCICGGILGVYSNASTVGTVAPKNDVENIYDVQSEKLANFAAVTSIETTAVTTTSTKPTTSFVISDSTTSTDETISVIYSAIPTTVATTTTVETTETTTSNDVIDIDYNDDENDEDEDVTYSASFDGGLTISGPFIASDETESTTTTEATTTAPVETTTTETTDEFVFEPATEYFPPAVEYTSPAQEEITTETTAVETTTTETTTTETATTETVVSETEETTTVTPAYIITTAEYTVTTTDVQSTETESDTTVVQGDKNTLPITDEEYIVLCNAVANEAGSNWIDLYEKGKVVEVIMNRVNSPLYPNTILGVITQPYQFTGSENYAYLGTYSGYVTEDVKDAVELYFNEPSSFAHNYFGFWGDGYANHFY